MEKGFKIFTVIMLFIILTLTSTNTTYATTTDVTDYSDTCAPYNGSETAYKNGVRCISTLDQSHVEKDFILWLDSSYGTIDYDELVLTIAYYDDTYARVGGKYSFDITYFIDGELFSSSAVEEHTSYAWVGSEHYLVYFMYHDDGSSLSATTIDYSSRLFIADGITTPFESAYITLRDTAIAVSDSYDTGYDDGEDNIIDNFLGTTLTDTNSDGYDDTSWLAGNTAGIDYSVFTGLLDGMSGIFQMVILPGITVGLLASIPIAFALLRWFLKLRG